MYTEHFIKARKFSPQEMFIRDNLVLETIMGSNSYGCSRPDSDIDIVGIFMDRHQDLYPQSYGMILGFNDISAINKKEHKGAPERIKLPDGKDCEGEWKSLTKFVALAGLQGSPILVETLFAQRNFVSHGTEIGWMLRDNRKLFLSAKTFYVFKGYAIGQLERIRRGHITKKSDNALRQEFLEKYGYDVKMANHLIRLIDELDQMITIGDVDLMRNREECLLMRNGQWGDYEKLEAHVYKRIAELEISINKSVVPPQPQIEKLRKLLLNCIEQFYGSVTGFQKSEYISAKDIKEQLDRIESKIK